MRTKAACLHSRHSVQGATLIEILVSVLILSFGLLAIGNMMAYAMQLPKVAGNRAVASTLAIDLVERMRANVVAFNSEQYGITTYDGTAAVNAVNAAKQCTYPDCTPEALAAQDLHDVARDARMHLPYGGIVVEKPGASGAGRVFVLWKEAASAGSLGNAGDICPALDSTLTETKPRCVMVNFTP